MPAPPQYLNVARGKKASRPQSQASPMSDDRSIASKFAAMEKKHQELEDRVAALELEREQQRRDR